MISSKPALAGRESAKLAALTDAVAGALRARGVAELPAVLVVRAGTAAFAHTTTPWPEEPEPGRVERLDAAARALRALLR